MATQSQGSILWLAVQMAEKLKTTSLTKTRLKSLDDYRLDRIIPGAIRGIKKQGYDLPVRKVREHNRKTEVTIPSFVRRELRVVKGNFVVFASTGIEGLIEVAEVGAVYERDVDGTPILGRMLAISKVRKSSGSYEISIPKVAQAQLGDVKGESVIFGLTHYPGVVTIVVIKRPGDSAGCRRGG
ncbi:hypothetical protein ES703_22915 [subsurface metagenome]